MKVTKGNENWQRSDAQIFWGEIAPYDHVVQIYEDDHIFMDLLGGFVCGGIRNGDSVIVIASASHLTQLKEIIKHQGFDPFSLSLKDQLIAVDAEETLSKFMVNGWPEENLFMQTVSGLLNRARRSNRQVRAFGEMVALLWANGHQSATVYLENLWNNFCVKEPFSLFCAYPRSGFTEDPQASMTHICCTHAKVINGMSSDTNEILFKVPMHVNA